MSTFGIRAASCPNCRVMFEASPQDRQRCPSCGHRFALSRVAPPLGFGSGELQAPALLQKARAEPLSTAYSNADRMVGAFIIGAAGAGLLWLGVNLDLRQLVSVGAITIGLVVIGALMSSFWRRYEELSQGQQTIVDLPRRVVWTVGRVLWGVLRLLVQILGVVGFGV